MAEINPSMMATQLATYYTQGAQDLIKTQTANAQKTSSALTRLQSALRAFEGVLSGLSAKRGLARNAATFSTSGIGTASATATAQAGTYSFFVEKLATAHQVAYEELPAESVLLGGPLVVELADGSSFNVNLLTADEDGNGTLSHAEIARAINQAEGNQRKVTAMVVTVGDKTQLVLSSGQTGEGGAITLNVSEPSPDPEGAPVLTPVQGKQLVAAQDAVVWLGPQGSGIEMKQASNTFTNIPGVSMTFERAMSAGDALLTLTVAPDKSATADNVKSFVDGYNALMKSLGELTKVGNADAGTASAAFATDAGVRMLRNKFNDILRQNFGGMSLMDLGIRADRNGQLSVDQAKLDKTLAADPDALDKVFGSSWKSASSGVLGAMGGHLDQWLSSTTGQIKRRQEAVQVMQKNLTARQARLDIQFDSAYERYLKQFTQVQSLSAQMNETFSMLQSLNTNFTKRT